MSADQTLVLTGSTIATGSTKKYSWWRNEINSMKLGSGVRVKACIYEDCESSGWD